MSTDERYVIRKKLADGGMAEVFLATQGGADRFSRLVVLKRLHRGISGHPQFRHMLADEAHIVMTLNHGNIVPVLDLAQRDGWYFLVMELVDGWDLRNVLARAGKAGFPLPRGLALHVTAEVCRGLAYAHAATSASGKPLGIVHRDISPQNVLLSEHGEVRVTDFGVAKALGKRTRTEAGVIKGSLDFMSPEQAVDGTVDASSDVFSTGALLYQLVTGQLPFRGANELETLQRVQKAEFTPPEEVKPDLAAPIAAIVKRAMQLRPSDRFRGAKEMMVEIEEFLRSDFPAPGKSELAAWLAELSRRDGELPASKRPGLPMDQPTIILGPADILSTEEESRAYRSRPPRTPAPTPAPPVAELPHPPPLPLDVPTPVSAPTPVPLLTPPPPLARRRALRLAVGGALTTAAMAVALFVTNARTKRPSHDPPGPLSGPAAPSPEPAPDQPVAPSPTASAEAPREPTRHPSVKKRPARTSRQKAKTARQKKGSTRKQAKAQPRTL
jgi:serine/threonine-protein kinase